MPVYRSPAEAEIRDAVIARLRTIRPESRIIHEINVAGQGSNRIDLIAVGETEIIAVEIKSEKDKLDRLPKQIEAMRCSAHYAIAALHEKFLGKEEASSHWHDYELDGKFFRHVCPPEAKGALTWIFPERAREKSSYGELGKWHAPGIPLLCALPSNALQMLWRDELYEMCFALRIPVDRRATMTYMARALRWQATGAELTKGICAALRARKCIEADPEIVRAA